MNNVREIKNRLETGNLAQKSRFYNQDVKFLIEELERTQKALRENENEQQRRDDWFYKYGN